MRSDVCGRTSAFARRSFPHLVSVALETGIMEPCKRFSMGLTSRGPAPTEGCHHSHPPRMLGEGSGIWVSSCDASSFKCSESASTSAKGPCQIQAQVNGQLERGEAVCQKVPVRRFFATL